MHDCEHSHNPICETLPTKLLSSLQCTCSYGSWNKQPQSVENIQACTRSAQHWYNPRRIEGLFFNSESRSRRLVEHLVWKQQQLNRTPETTFQPKLSWNIISATCLDTLFSETDVHFGCLSRLSAVTTNSLWTRQQIQELSLKSSIFCHFNWNIWHTDHVQQQQTNWLDSDLISVNLSHMATFN